MTQVDFYILDDSDAAARAQFACRLAERASDAGHTVYLHTEDEAQTRWIDELLWSFRADSFIAHDVASSGSEDSPLLLGHAESPTAPRDVLINLAAQVPTFFSRFPRTLEIIAGDPVLRAAGRARYSYYKDRGYPLRHHRIGASGKTPANSGGASR